MRTRQTQRGLYLPGRSVLLNLAAATVVSCAAVLLIIPPAHSSEDRSSESDSDQSKKQSVVRLEAMRLRAASLSATLETGEKPRAVKLVENPVLRYNNLSGETTDATIWVWGNAGRPIAISTISYERPDVGGEKWSCELTSLSDQPIALAAKSGWTWNPAKSGIEWMPLADAPIAGETAAARGRQMKEIALRYSASETFSETRTDQLRLMDRPLHRYADPDQGLVDGGLYAFAAGTNPEILLLIECRKDQTGKPAWSHGFARLGAAACEARLGEKIVWRRPAIRSWAPREPYYSYYGPDSQVFGE